MLSAHIPSPDKCDMNVTVLQVQHIKVSSKWSRDAMVMVSPFFYMSLHISVSCWSIWTPKQLREVCDDCDLWLAYRVAGLVFLEGFEPNFATFIWRVGENRLSVWWLGVRERMLPTRDRTLGSAGGAQAFSSIKMPTGASAWVGLDMPIQVMSFTCLTICWFIYDLSNNMCLSAWAVRSERIRRWLR
jgi:hypothetical protein